MSLDYALDMALLEKDNNIHSSYYILLQSDLYNAHSPEGTDKIRKIREAGHSIGLHVDTRYYTGAIEFSILSNIAQTTVLDWCQHMVNGTPPLPFGLDNDARNAHKCRDSGYKYLSDSAMNWREGCWCKHINEYNKLEILIHPEWTMYDPTGQKSKWEIMQGIAAEGRLQLTKSFHQFEDIVKYYEQSIDIYSVTKRPRSCS